MRHVPVAIASCMLALCAPGHAAVARATVAAPAHVEPAPGNHADRSSSAPMWIVFIALFGVLGIGMRRPVDPQSLD